MTHASEGRCAEPTWREEAREQMRLAGPLIAAQASIMAMGLVDTAVVGRFDSEALGAVAMGGAIAFVALTPAMGFALALDPLVAQALGQGRRDLAWSWFAAGVRVCAVASIPASLAGLAIAAALGVIDIEPALQRHVFDYLLWRLPATAGLLLLLCCKALLQAHGATRPLLLSALVANVLNWALDWVCVFGDAALERVGLPALGVPALGAAGAAIATSVSTLFMVGWLALSVKPYRCRERPRDFPADATRRLLRLGTPVGLQTFAETSAFSVVGIFAGKLGGVTAGAHQIALQLASFSFMAAYGIASATAVRVGFAVGRGHAVLRAGSVGTVMAMAFMSASAALFALAPEALSRLFTPDDPRALAVAVPLIRIAAAFQLFDALQVVMAGALRGAGDVRMPFIANAVAHWGVGLPTALLLAFPGGYGAQGLWVGLTASLVSVSSLLAWRFFGHVARTAVSPL